MIGIVALSMETVMLQFDTWLIKGFEGLIGMIEQFPLTQHHLPDLKRAIEQTSIMVAPTQIEANQDNKIDYMIKMLLNLSTFLFNRFLDKKTMPMSRTVIHRLKECRKRLMDVALKIP